VRSRGGALSPRIGGALVALVLLCGCPTDEPEAPTPGACADGELADQDAVGALVCVPERCGLGPWGQLDRSGAVHVAPWGDEDGDGSEEAPLNSIQDAVDLAVADGRVVVASNGAQEARYEENLSLGSGHQGVTIAGRCPELVRIDGSGADAPTWRQSGGDLSASGLTISGGNGGIWVDAIGSAVGRFSHLVLAGNITAGVVAFGSAVELEFEDCLISDNLPTELGQYGRGLDVEEGAHVVLRRVALSGNHNIGAYASMPGTLVELEDCTISDMKKADALPLIVGLSAQEEGTILGTRVVLEGNQDVGLAAVQGGRVELTDSVIRDTRPAAGANNARGANVQLGGHLVGTRLTIEGSSYTGLFVHGEGSVAELEDSVIRDGRSVEGGRFGHGAQVVDGGLLIGRRLLLEANREVGLFVGGVDAVAELEDSFVTGTLLDASGRVGEAIAVQTGGTLLATGLELTDNQGVGVALNGIGAYAELADSLVARTSASASLGSGQGVSAQNGAVIAATALVVEDNEGPGLYAVAGGHASFDESSLRRNGFAGVVLLAGGRFTATGGRIDASIPSAGSGGGVGVYAWDLFGANQVELTGTTLSGHPGPGLYVVGEGTVSAVDCSFEDSGAGVLAAAGIGRWQHTDDDPAQVGLLLEGNTFDSLTGDAILLDLASATLVGNTFTALEGEPLYRQHCDGTEPPDVGAGSPVDPECQQWSREIDPLLVYASAIIDPEIAD
jgi:hypothetical protein